MLSVLLNKNLAMLALVFRLKAEGFYILCMLHEKGREGAYWISTRDSVEYAKSRAYGGSLGKSQFLTFLKRPVRQVQTWRKALVT